MDRKCETNEEFMESCTEFVQQLNILHPDANYTIDMEEGFYLLRVDSGVPYYLSDDLYQFHANLHGRIQGIESTLGIDEVYKLEELSKKENIV